MRRNATDESTPSDLTGQQEAVLAALLTGNTITAAASDAGIARQTVHRWLTADAAFIAAYNAERRELANTHAVRILAMCGAALDVLESAMQGGDVKAALAVLKGAGVFGGEAAQIEGSDNVDEVRNEQKRRVKAEELQNLMAGI